MHIKKALYALAIWLIPILLILIEATLFLSKVNWQSAYLPYFITFWGIRAFLAPFIVLYTLRFWEAHNKALYLFLLHGAGFLLFSVLFWTLSFLVLQDTLHNSTFFGLEKTSTDIGVFGMIVDNSISTNCIVYASTVGFCYIWEFFKRNISINKRAMELERSLLTSRLDVLKGQLNTHFLFNTLHTISSFVVRKQNEDANKMLIRLSDLLRFALKENKEQLIPVHKEMELLQMCIDIQQVRFKERLTVRMDVDPSLYNMLMPSLLLQPILENAIKYGIEPFREAGNINIVIKKEGGKLILLVKDDGKTPYHEIKFDDGIGLSNTRERLEQLYGSDHVFSIRPNKTQGVIISIRIPEKINAHGALESLNS